MRAPFAAAVYVPGEPRPRSSAVRVLEVAARRPTRAKAPELAITFRARCDKCGWLGRPRTSRSAALRLASGHSCLPVAGGVATPVSDLTRIPWLRP